MKTNHYLTLSAVIVAGFISCTSENLVSETPPTGKTNEPTAMSFDVHTQNQTRAKTGALQESYKDFGVWAYKNMPEGTTVEDQIVMPNYLVGYYDEAGNDSYYGNGTATIGDTSSEQVGQSMWFYVGLGNDYSHSNETGDNAPQYKTSSPSVNATQELRYWDYNSESTDFFAYAPYGNGNLYEFNSTNKEISTTDWVWAGFSNQDYQEKLLAHKNVEKVNYGKDVQLTFKRINAAVQLAFYAPIPGFWTEVNSIVVESAHQDETSGAIVTGDNDKVAYGTKVKIGTGDVISVTASDRYHIKADNDVQANSTANTFGAVTGVESVSSETYTSLIKALGTDNTNLSYAANTFFAMPASTVEADKNSGFKVHVVFTIYSQNTNETQNLQGDVFISPDYTQWKSNYKYVYIFKLTHQTPIVFDGITISDYDTEESIPESTIVGETNNNN